MWVVEIDSISVLGVEIGLISVYRWKLTWSCVKYPKGLSFGIGIKMYIIQCWVLFNLVVVWGIEIDLVLGCGSKFRLRGPS